MYGKALRERRKALHMSQGQLAEKAGISLATVANIEKGVSYPREDTVRAIRNAMSGLSTDKPYGQRLREARKSKALTIEELSFDTGVSTATLYSLEKGLSHPRKITHMKLVELLGEI